MFRDREYLADMLDAARLALSFAEGKTRDQFLADIQCQDAVIRRLVILGEAARRTSPAFRAGLSQLPWKRLIAMRNVMVHEYEDIDLGIVWDTVKNDLPPLVADLEKALSLGPFGVSDL